MGRQRDSRQIAVDRRNEEERSGAYNDVLDRQRGRGAKVLAFGNQVCLNDNREMVSGLSLTGKNLMAIFCALSEKTEPMKPETQNRQLQSRGENLSDSKQCP